MIEQRSSMRMLTTIVLLSGWLAFPRAASADLKVVTTTADLASIVRSIGGRHVEVTSLALPTQDPHFVDARPHLALKLARADLLIAVGLDLEIGWLPTLQTAARNGRIQAGAQGYLACGSLVDVLDAPTQRVDRSMGDVHTGGNPHYLFDPRAGARCAAGIATRMSELDPEYGSQYRENLQRFVRALDQARTRWESALASLRGMKVVAYHRSFPYLANWLGLRIVAHIEPRPGIPPTPRHVARVLELTQRENVRMILQERHYPDATSRLIAERSNARLVRIPGAPDIARGETYIDFIQRIVNLLQGAAAPAG